MIKNMYLLLGAILLFIGCGDSSKVPAEVGKTVCVLFDLSGTTNKPEIRRAYVDHFKVIMDRVTHGDAISVALITEFSAGELRLLFQHQFPVFDPGSDKTELQLKAYESTLKEGMQKVKDSLFTIAQATLTDTTRRIMRTDIMTSLQVAERVFKNSHQPRKILVILSDMIEDSNAYNFEREELTDKRISDIIERERNRKRLPDLSTVKVYVVGALAKNAMRYERIQAFWFEYFKACGATLASENYGAAMIGFDE